ncbi:hypothetical protein FQN57_006949 [Myotisia sp. PD_48]|nr:hypothetical protein FQN57_006949 [Myotisia sp. PD_48]
MDQEKPQGYGQHAAPRPAPEGGFGLFALKTINAGDEVAYTQNSFSAVLDTDKLADACSNCFGTRMLLVQALEPPEWGTRDKDIIGLKACTGCRVVKYCDKICQSQNWAAGHKAECALFKKLHPRILPINARALLRIIFHRASKKFEALQDTAMFNQLNTHLKEIAETNKEQHERILLSAKAVHEYSETKLDLDLIIDYCAKLEINGFTLTTPFYDRIGLCVQPYSAFANHSCDPNAVVGFDAGAVILRAVRNIEKDEQVYISYVDSTNPFETRQKELSERYFFQCKCSKCLLKGNTREDTFLPLPSSAPALDIAVLKEAKKKALDLLATSKTPGISTSSAVVKIRSAMKVLRNTKVWPITRQPYPLLRDELIVALVENGAFYAALGQAAIRHLRVDPILYPQEQHPIRATHAWALVTILSSLMRYQLGEHVRGEELYIRFNFNLAELNYDVGRSLCKIAKYQTPTIKEIFEAGFQKFRGAEDDGMQMARYWDRLETYVNKLLPVAEESEDRQRSAVTR